MGPVPKALNPQTGFAPKGRKPMTLGDWARKTFTKKNIEFTFGILSPFLVWGMLIFWFHWTIKGP